MRSSKAVLALAAAAVLLAAVSVLGCNGTSATSPYGGGGGTGGTAFDSGSLTAPATYIHVFPTAGAVGYHCNFHVNMGMVGTVNVVSGAADSAAVSANGTSFTPSAVSIKPGGFVRWTIAGGTHTVTSN